MLRLLCALWGRIQKPQRLQLYLLLLLMLFVASVEMLSIGAIFPFIAVLTNPEKLFHHPLGQYISGVLNVTEAKYLLLPVTIAFVTAVVCAGCMRLLLVWVQTRVSYLIGHEFAVDVYKRTLYLPYVVHTQLNSGEAINSVYSKASGVSSTVLMPALTIISAIVLGVAILIMLISLDPVVSLTALFGFSFIYFVVAKLTHKRLLKNSRQVADEAGKVIRSIQEGLGGVRDVLLDRSQMVYCDHFKQVDLSMRKAQIDSAIIAQGPRFAVEAMGLVLIAILAYKLAGSDGGMVAALPLLAGLALGAQRLLPLLQQGFQAWSSMKANQASLEDTLLLLNQPGPEFTDVAGAEAVPYNHTLRLDNLWFRYQADIEWVLKGVSLEVPKGAKIGFVGATGCGKSTLLDIVMGLLLPTRGSLFVDGKPLDQSSLTRWQKHIAHVPQNVFLADTSIASNIAFGVPFENIDMDRVRDAARRAQLLKTIESWPAGFDSTVGERGVRLSGGQRQRIGIARALYKKADVLVFDEATSALDSETERAVMENIQALGSEITVLLIAHRVNTLSNCNLIVELNNGIVARQGSYKEMTGS